MIIDVDDDTNLIASLRRQLTRADETLQTVSEQHGQAIAALQAELAIICEHRDTYRSRCSTVGQEAARLSDRLQALDGRITTICDEEFGLQPVQPAEQSLTQIERRLFERRRLVEAAARASERTAEALGLPLDASTSDIVAAIGRLRS